MSPIILRNEFPHTSCARGMVWPILWAPRPSNGSLEAGLEAGPQHKVITRLYCRGPEALRAPARGRPRAKASNGSTSGVALVLDHQAVAWLTRGRPLPWASTQHAIMVDSVGGGGRRPPEAGLQAGTPGGTPSTLPALGHGKA